MISFFNGMRCEVLIDILKINKSIVHTFYNYTECVPTLYELSNSRLFCELRTILSDSTFEYVYRFILMDNLSHQIKWHSII